MRPSAFAISIIWRCATESESTRRRVCTSRPTAVEQLLRDGVHRAAVDRAGGARSAGGRGAGSRRRSAGRRAGTPARPSPRRATARGACRRESSSSPAIETVPTSGATDPAITPIIVDFPAPFSPTRPTTSPRSQDQLVEVEDDGRPVQLADTGEDEVPTGVRDAVGRRRANRRQLPCCRRDRPTGSPWSACRPRC